MKINRKKKSFKQYLIILPFILAGLVCGILAAGQMEVLLSSEATLSILEEIGGLGELFLFLVLLFLIYVSLFLHIIVHEAGHLIFGLLTGYHFTSFRIGSLMLLREKPTQSGNGKMYLKKLSLAGTGGQCLMSPPDMKDGVIPFVLYNLGGSLFNIITALLSLILFIPFRDIPFLSFFLSVFSVIGLCSAAVNGIPLRTETVNNDGYNALSLGKNKEALTAFFIQLKANELVSKGLNLEDMPEDWFEIPSEESMKNSMTATIGVFACNRLIEEYKLEEAYALMDRFLQMDTGIVELHKKLLVADCIYCELILDLPPKYLDKMEDKKQIKFMKSMKTFPSVLRTEYSYALLHKKDLKKAGKIEKQFEKTARSYPYPSSIAKERELIDYAKQKYEETQKSYNYKGDLL